MEQQMDTDQNTIYIYKKWQSYDSVTNAFLDCDKEYNRDKSNQDDLKAQEPYKEQELKMVNFPTHENIS